MNLPIDPEDSSWMADGFCRHEAVKAEWWFPPNGDELHSPALTVCKQCPVRDTCLEWAMFHNEKYGIWGGKTAAQRRRMRERSQKPYPTRCAGCDKWFQASRRMSRGGGRQRYCSDECRHEANKESNRLHMFAVRDVWRSA